MDSGQLQTALEQGKNIQLRIRAEDFKEFETLLFSLEINNCILNWWDKRLTLIVDCGLYYETYEYKLEKGEQFYYFTTA